MAPAHSLVLLKGKKEAVNQDKTSIKVALKYPIEMVEFLHVFVKCLFGFISIEVCCSEGFVPGSLRFVQKLLSTGFKPCNQSLVVVAQLLSHFTPQLLRRSRKWDGVPVNIGSSEKGEVMWGKISFEGHKVWGMTKSALISSMKAAFF